MPPKNSYDRMYHASTCLCTNGTRIAISVPEYHNSQYIDSLISNHVGYQVVQ